jgi:hypothetical protein
MIITQFIPDKENHHQAAGKREGQPKNIDGGKNLVSP